MSLPIVLISLFDFESIGIRSLSGALHRDQIDHRVLYFQPLRFNTTRLPSEEAYDAILNQLIDLAPRMIGLSVRSPFAGVAEELTARIRQKNSATIVWGGAHASVEWETSLEHADLVCRGEGEEAVVHLARTGGSGSLPPGIVSRGATAPSVYWVSDLDALADPLYSNELSLHFMGSNVVDGDPLLTENSFAHYGEAGLFEVLGSRGCPFSCTYCSAPTISSRHIRYRSVDRVIAEVQRLASIRTTDRICFLDEVFGADMNWLRELADKFPRGTGLPFTAEIHPSLVTDERIRLSTQAGLAGVEMGIQSGSHRERSEVFARRVSNDVIIKAVDTLHRYGVAVTVDIILDDPYATEDDLRETFMLLQHLQRPLGIKTFSLCHLPGTVLTNRLLSEGRIERNDVEDRACKAHRAWRARVGQQREPWKKYWTTLIMLAGQRNLSDQEGSWLATAMGSNAPKNRFSPTELEQITADEAYRRDPNLLIELYEQGIPDSHRAQVA